MVAQISESRERPWRCGYRNAFLLRQAIDLTKAQAKGGSGRVTGNHCFQHGVPFAAIDIGMAHLNTVIARIADDLCRGIKTHGLRIEESCGKDRRIVAFEPGRDIDEMSKARRMTFGK